MIAVKYILRSLKYFIKLLILLAILFALMMLSETSTLSFDNLGSFIASFFDTPKGWLFTVAVLVWCAIYPKVEFVTRHMNYDMHEGKDAIIRAFTAGKMMLSDEEDGKMKFHGVTIGRRLWFLWDDTVTLTRNPSGGFDMEGPRKFVGEAQQRIPGYMDMAKISPLETKGTEESE